MQSRTPDKVGQLGNANADILVTVALIELLVLVNHAIFMPATGLHKLLSSDMQSFQYKYLDSEGDKLNLVMLVVLIITPEHQDKTVVHLGQGTCKKGIDALLA